MALQNIGRKETNFFSEILNNIRGSYRYLTNFNFIKKSKINAAHSYDISDDLYDLFLDSKRQYSCAYFKNENESLETAQNNKIEHIIKKLNFKPNQKVLDIGSGWGSLAIEIAKKYRFQPRLFPITRDKCRHYFEQACFRAKVKNFRFHDLRACAITNLFLNGWSIAEVSVVSGHKTWSELKRYTRIQPDSLVGKINSVKVISQ